MLIFLREQPSFSVPSLSHAKKPSFMLRTVSSPSAKESEKNIYNHKYEVTLTGSSKSEITRLCLAVLHTSKPLYLHMRKYKFIYMCVFY